MFAFEMSEVKSKYSSASSHPGVEVEHRVEGEVKGLTAVGVGQLDAATATAQYAQLDFAL